MGERVREKLQSELIERARRNPKYSLRAFAKHLQVESSSLSQIINGKRPLTRKMCERLLSRLDIEPSEYDYFLGKATSLKARKEFDSYATLDGDAFKVISDWYHYAILELTHVEGFQGDPKWIARVLGISVNEVHDAVRRLKRLNYLKVEKNGKWIDQLGDANNLGNQYTHAAFRKLQKQVLLKALDALEEIPYSERIQTSMTLPVSKARLEEAKRRTLSFVEEISEFLRAGKTKDEVYHLGFSLYPVSHTERGASR